MMQCHPLSLASVKSRLVLPFWYWLTWVVPDKGPLNVCVCVCISVVGAMMTEAHEHLTSCTIDCVQLNIHSCGTVLALHVCLMVNLRLNILCLIFVGVAF